MPNWFLSRIIIWIVLILFTIATLYSNLIGKLTDPFLTFILIVEGTLVAELTLYEIMKKRESADIRIELVEKGNDIGFGVRSMNKTLKDAWPLCNKKRYPWDAKEGQVEKRDIFVGEEPPAAFYPFTLERKWILKDDIAEYVKPQNAYLFSLIGMKADEAVKSARFGIFFTFLDHSTKEVIWRYLFLVPPKELIPSEYPVELDLRGPLTDMLDTVGISIRIIAEGIEEERDYYLGLTLSGIRYGEFKETGPLYTYSLDLKRRRHPFRKGYWKSVEK